MDSELKREQIPLFLMLNKVHYIYHFTTMENDKYKRKIRAELPTLLCIFISKASYIYDEGYFAILHV